MEHTPVALQALLHPIGLSALLVFLTTAACWLLLPHHRSDVRPLPDEASALEALGRQGLAPGVYRFPFGGAPQDRAFADKLDKGPSGLIVVTRARPRSVGWSVGFSILHALAVSLAVGFVASRSLAAGAAALSVFQVTGAVAVLAYSAALVQESLWWGRPWRTTLKTMADGVACALVTAAVFAWLWPGR
jgi:hypothetical protein